MSQGKVLLVDTHLEAIRMVHMFTRGYGDSRRGLIL